LLRRVNWDLPNGELERIWGLPKYRAGSRRSGTFRPASLWEREARFDAPEYQAALSADEAKVRQLRQDLGAEAEGRIQDLPASLRAWIRAGELLT
jgi:hypothetical protein